jgi:PAS domain S-box-containing protein
MTTNYELIQLRSKLKVHNSISRDFAMGEGLEDTVYRILKTLCVNYHWEIGIFWKMEEDRELRYVTSWYRPKFKNSPIIDLKKNSSLNIGTGLPGISAKNKKAKWIRDIGTISNRKLKEAAKETQISGAYAVPVIYDKKVLGVLEFLRTSKETPGKEFRDIIRSELPNISQYLKKKVNEAKILLNEEKAETLIELAPAIVYSVNKDHVITSLNPAVEKITGMKRQDLIGKPLTTLICPDDREYAKEKFKDNLKSNTAEPFEVEIITSTDETLIGEIKEKTKMDDGNIIETFGIIRDVTERYLLERQREVWLGVATHELKTPLTSIKAYTQLMQQKLKGSNKDFETYLTRIDKLTNRMSRLINEFMDITRIRSGELELNMDKLDICGIIKEVVKDIQHTTDTHKIIYKQSRPIYVKGDKQRITEVFSNLIDNAIKYSPESDKVMVSTTSTGNSVTIKVKDFGHGIKEENVERIFDLFYREARDHQKTSGMGMGLFISKAIIKGHRGSIRVNSVVGEGTTFSVILPLYKLSGK